MLWRRGCQIAPDARGVVHETSDVFCTSRQLFRTWIHTSMTAQNLCMVETCAVHCFAEAYVR